MKDFLILEWRSELQVNEQEIERNNLIIPLITIHRIVHQNQEWRIEVRKKLYSGKIFHLERKLDKMVSTDRKQTITCLSKNSPFRKEKKCCHTYYQVKEFVISSNICARKHQSFVYSLSRNQLLLLKPVVNSLTPSQEGINKTIL